MYYTTPVGHFLEPERLHMVDLQSIVPDVLVTTYLEMNEVAQFRPEFVNLPQVQVICLERPDLAFYRFLYGEVGRVWRWRDRLIMSEDDLRQAISKVGVSIHVIYVDGAPAGYVELAQQGELTRSRLLWFTSRLYGHGVRQASAELWYSRGVGRWRETPVGAYL